jgi:N,N-dimethylformamidase
MSDDTTRRDVLRGLGGLAFASALGCDAASDLAVVRSALGTCAATVIPAVANAAFAVPTVEGYSQKSVAAGDQVDFRISSPVNYQLSIVRLGWDIQTPSRDWVLNAFPATAASQQSVAPGSYVHVERALGSTQPFPQLTLECWVRTFRTGGVGLAQGIISQYSFPNACGFVLFLDANNVPFFYLGDGGGFNGNYLWEQAGTSITAYDNGPTWHHLVLVFDAGTATLYVDGNVYTTMTGLPSAVMAGSAPLRLGAAADSTGTRYFLDGDIAMPVIYSAALTSTEVQTRYTQVMPNIPPAVPSGFPSAAALIGCWPLTEEGGTDVADVSGCARPGVIVNHGTWMVGGPGFDASTVPRLDSDSAGNLLYYPYQNSYNPDDPSTMAVRGHGLRLSTTDFYDCGWPVSFSYTIPNDCPPGLYVGRISDTNVPSTRLCDVTFVVRGATARPVAPIVVLSASNTWLAYNPSVNALAAPGAPSEKVRFYEHLDGSEADVPYRQPNYLQGFEMPWSGAADPYLTYPQPPNSYVADGYTYGHLVMAERGLHVWLERNGYDYDLVSDMDLDGNPTLLSQYRLLIIAGHSEYWTINAYNNVMNYIGAGGQVLVASGNTMFWRVSYDATTIECRKAPKSVGGLENADGKWGELYHQQDHLRGGLMRDAGLPAWPVIGLECSTFTNPFPAYTVVNSGHPFFQTPEFIPATNGVTLIGGGSSVGHECDARLQNLAGTLPFVLPADQPTSLAESTAVFGRFDYEANWEQVAEDNVVSEIVDWVRPGGGRVSNVGSIAAGQALLQDAALAALFRNVLYQDGVTVNVNALMIGTDGQFRQKYFDGTNWLATLDNNGGVFGPAAPAGVQWGPNARSAMAIDASGAFQYTYNLGAGWAGWTTFGTGFTGRPAAVGWGRNRIDLFARSTGGALMQMGWDGVNWSSWSVISGSILSDPSAVNWQGNHLGVAALGGLGDIFYFSRASTDSGWTFESLGSIGTNFNRAPTLLSWGGNRVDIFAVDSIGACSYKYFDGTSWSPSWTGIGAPTGGRGFTGLVWAAIPGPDQILLVGLGPNARLRHKIWDGNTWQPSQTGWYDTLGGSFAGEPALASYRGGFVSLAAVDTAGNLWHNLWNGSAFMGWTNLVTGGVSPSPALFPHILS